MTASEGQRTSHASVLTAIRSAVASAPNPDAAMTQAVRLLKDAIPYYSWVGIYLLDGDELVLGPFLGKPSPHTRIPLGRGICGAAATEKTTIVVDDVNADARYLACSIETQLRDRRADHARTATCSARSTSTAIRRPPSAMPTAPSSKRSRRCSPKASRRTSGPHHHADSRRRHRSRGHRRRRPHLQGGRPRHRLGPARRRRHRLQAVRPVAARRSCSTRSGRTRWRSRGR